MIRLNLFMIWFLHFLSLLSVICRCYRQNSSSRIIVVLVYTVSTLFYDLEFLYEISPGSFLPPPTVKSALLKIKRKQSSIDFELKVKYLAFISCLLQKPDLSVRTALKSIFRKSQVRSISEKFGINLNAQIVCLSPSQWKNCFLEMLEVVPEKFHPS